MLLPQKINRKRSAIRCQQSVNTKKIMAVEGKAKEGFVDYLFKGVNYEGNQGTFIKNIKKQPQCRHQRIGGRDCPSGV